MSLVHVFILITQILGNLFVRSEAKTKNKVSNVIGVSDKAEWIRQQSYCKYCFCANRHLMENRFCYFTGTMCSAVLDKKRRPLKLLQRDHIRDNLLACKGLVCWYIQKIWIACMTCRPACLHWEFNVLVIGF